MKTIHVYLSDEMYDRLQYFIKSEGFKGRSEFFRFMIKYFEYLPPNSKQATLGGFRVRKPYQPNYSPDSPTQQENPPTAS